MRQVASREPARIKADGEGRHTESATKVRTQSQAGRIPRTTISLRKVTKNRLDSNRAPGQCYDGALCQLMDIWDKVKEGRYRINTKLQGDGSDTAILMGGRKNPK